MRPEHIVSVTQDSDRQRTILCVEDEADLRHDLVEELVAAGYRVIEAGDGLEALQKLETAQPDAILCDITMPELGGYELMAKLNPAYLTGVARDCGNIEHGCACSLSEHFH